MAEGEEEEAHSAAAAAAARPLALIRVAADLSLSLSPLPSQSVGKVESLQFPMMEEELRRIREESTFKQEFRQQKR